MMGADFYQGLEEMDADQKSGRPLVGIGSNTIIRKAIIDKNVRVGSNCRILNEAGLEYHDGDNYFIREGIIVIPKGVTIPDETVI
jgi:glucose-1-phosphate adenylyltransferase